MKITGFKVTIKSIYSTWVPESIDCDHSEREAVEQIIKEQYAAMGLEVLDVRLQFQEGEAKPKQEQAEPDVPDGELRQYHRPRMHGPVRYNEVINNTLTQ